MHMSRDIPHKHGLGSCASTQGSPALPCTSMCVKSVQLGFSRCAGRATGRVASWARSDPGHRGSFGPP
eukprot:15432132-Alexandrium_andersonii.AAC.1